MLQTGLTGEKRLVVSQEHTAQAMGSGGLAVLATPWMIAFMEHTADRSVAAFLPPEEATVGVDVHIRHLAATPVGMTVTFESTLTAIDGNRLTFAVKAYDEDGLIGEGEHTRCIVDIVRFMSRVQQKGMAKHK